MQLLREHLRNVSECAAQFAEDAGLNAELGRWAGLLHDLGKYSDEFQRKLAAHDRSTLVEHACHGAAIAAKAQAIEVAFAVNAHHHAMGTKGDIAALIREGGRPDQTVGAGGERVYARAERFLALARADAGILGNPQRSDASDMLAAELRTRMLLSCLADADRLDAERWGSRDKYGLRQASLRRLDPGARLRRVLSYIEGLDAEARKVGRGDSDVNLVRRQVLTECLNAAAEDPGFFSLTVPTGGGKTLSSLAFALRHAQEHALRRVIYVLPFLTIIEQNAEVLKVALGDADAVLEHHSNVAATERTPAGDPADEDLARRLLAENWEAPVVITTAVQFFESLFSAHPTRLRKVHNVPGSVVIFDEVQTFPPAMLRPILGMLQQLVRDYRCSFVFCTATQPAFELKVDGKDLLPAGSVREIVSNPEDLFARLRRVEVTWPAEGETLSMAQVAAQMAEHGQALAIVNTKKQARELYDELKRLDETAVHLSTRMCAEHRSLVLTDVRRRLKDQERCLVASTQLVEAGVDVDFPAVWRAIGPLDSIAQAAGRCNREGRLGPLGGKVTVFRPEDGSLPFGGGYLQATQTTESMLRAGQPDLYVPGVYDEYFERYYAKKDLDEKKVVRSREALDFAAVDKDFAIIGDETLAVIVPYGAGLDAIRRIEAGDDLSAVLLRRLQRFVVSLYPGEFKRAAAEGALREQEKLGIWYAPSPDDYDDALGLILPDDAQSTDQ
jgi:CRISPR-associated endonuclease/helicase Cas3